MSAKISFIISTNRSVLKSISLARDILESQGDFDMEIIIVNQSNEEVTSKMKEPKIKVISTDERGLSRSRNLGIANSTGEWIVVLDDDVMVAGNFLETFFGVKREVNCCYVSSVRTFEHEFYNPRQSEKPRILNKWSVDAALSVGLVLSTSLLENVGGFDEHLGLGCRCGSGEETDLLLRIIKTKSQVIYDPDMVIYHPKDNFDFRTSLLRSFKYGVGRGCIIRKCGKDQGIIWTVFNLFIIPFLKICYAVFSLNIFRLMRYSSNSLGIITGLRSW